MVRSRTPLVLTMSLLDTMTTSKRLRDVIVTLVGLSINWWAFTEAQKDRRASLLGFLNSRSQFASPVSTMSLLLDKAFTYAGISSFSRQERPMVSLASVSMVTRNDAKSRRWLSDFWVKMPVFSTSFNNKSKSCGWNHAKCLFLFYYLCEEQKITISRGFKLT